MADTSERKLTLTLDGIEVNLNEYVSNTLIQICEVLKNSLKLVPKNSTGNNPTNPSATKFIFDFSLPEKKQVQLIAGEKSIPMKLFIKNMIFGTIGGFITSLDGVPETLTDLKKSLIEIIYSDSLT